MKTTPVIQLKEFGLTMRLIRKLLSARAETEGIDLTVNQYILLKVMMHRKEAMIQQDIANFLDTDKSGILRQIDSLEKRKLIARTPDDNDRRKNVIIITKLGIELCNKFLAIEEAVMAELQDGIAKTDMEGFKKVLARIQMNAREK